MHRDIRIRLPERPVRLSTETVDRRPQPEIVAEAAGSAERKVLHISGIRSHPPATNHAVVRPWPRQGPWRDLLRQAGKNRGRRGSGKSGSR